MSEEGKRWTLRELMKTAIEYLSEKGFDEARLTVELLLSHTLNLQRIELYTNFDRPLTREEVQLFRSLFERRLRHEPVQYIVQSAFFMGLQLEVDSRVLIPRPETETLVEEALFLCKSYSHELHILDVGTGSGNIAISLAKYANNVRVTALDSSADALVVAYGNATRHGVLSKIHFVHADIFQPLPPEACHQYDMIISNPPYVPVDEWESLQPEVRRFEPRHAITDNADGLSFYKQLLTLSNSYLKPAGFFLVEIGFGQESRVSLLLQSLGFTDVRIVPDLQKIPRVVRAMKASQPFQPN